MNRRIAIACFAVAVTAVAVLGNYRLGWIGGEPRAGLALNGNVDIRQVDLGFRVAGRIEAIHFDEGAHVLSGIALAQLDPATYLAAIAEARGQAGVDRAELEKLQNGNRVQDIQQAQADLDQARATLLQTRLDYERDASLAGSAAVSKQTLDLAQAQYQVSQAKVEAAGAALSLMHVGARQEDIDAAAAQLGLAVAQAGMAKIDLADTILYAPCAGTILVRALEPGAIVAAGTTVMTLTIDRPMRIRAYIDEPDLYRISPGMRVLVSTDGNPRTYQGTIGFISPMAEFTPKTVQTTALRADLVYRLRIIIDDPDDALRQGAPVSVMVPDARPGAGS
jgi:HlyD family secretion protein